MMFNVPQFVDVEDKIAGPLTAKQLLWMIGMGAAILVIRLFTGGGASMYIISVPVIVIFFLFAFYRPNEQSLVMFVVHGIFYLFRPKVMIWRRPHIGAVFPSANRGKKEDASASQPTTRRATLEEIRETAEMLDRGAQTNN